MQVKSILFVISLLFVSFTHSTAQISAELNPYIHALKTHGIEPVRLILEKASQYDLLLFDDALHTAVEPFDFYIKLIRNPEFQKKIKYIFLEVVSVNQQAILDKYFESPNGELALLSPAFQNDFSGTGWPYKTYFDLLKAVWEVNSNLPSQDRFIVAAVNSPTYWNEIKTARDLELFRLSIAGNDYTMYKIILNYLDNFKAGKKGIFLTNTRHAYKRIVDLENNDYLNRGTFFFLRHPGKAYSIRLHNINLYFEGQRQIDHSTPQTTQGLENVMVKWVRMEKGLWDSAFRMAGNTPIALDMQGTPFGAAAYIGNHMLNVAAGQTMSDAYDAVIFLGPVEQLHQTAMVDLIYTEEFKDELERRIKILHTPEQITHMLQKNNLKSLREYISMQFTFRPEIVQPLAEQIGPIDEWKTPN